MTASSRPNLALLATALTVTASLTLAGQPPAEQTLDPVLVTAERLGAGIEAERAATPGAVSVIDGEALQERTVTQVAEMLRYVPGVFAESYNGNDDVFYSSRGSNLDATDYDKNGIKFLQDGLPVTAADGNNHNRAVDPLNARYVTVAHGANALAYGASTLGGAIDLVSPTAHNTASSIALSGGSFGQWGARATLGAAAGALDGLLSAETQQRDGYRDHSLQDRRSAYGNLGWQASENVGLRLYGTWNDYDTDLPRELSAAQMAADRRQARDDAIEGDHGKQVKTWRVATKAAAQRMAGGTLEIGVSHEEQSLYHPIVSTPFFSLLIDTDHADSGAMLRYRATAGSHALILGANYGYSTVKGGNYENDGGRRGALMWTTDDAASGLELFALDRWNFAPRWTLVYGAQYTRAKRDVAGLKAGYDGFNPRVGVIASLAEGAEWFASVSRLYEAPTTFELTDDRTGGSTALDAMHGVVVESGVRGSGHSGATRFHWDVAAYYTALRDEILSIDDPDAPGTSLSANIDKTVHAGVEALLGASFDLGSGHHIDPLLNVTYNAFTFDADATWGNNRLPAAPRYFARGELLYRNAAGLSVGPTFDVVGARYSDFANTYRVGSYSLIGARAVYSANQWQVFAEARNLTDRNYVATVLVRDVTAPDAQVLFPGAPRSVYLGVRYQF